MNEDEDEVEAILYETDGDYMALCPQYPGVTGAGHSRDECLNDLTQKIHLHITRGHIVRALPEQEDILRKVAPMRPPGLEEPDQA